MNIERMLKQLDSINEVIGKQGKNVKIEKDDTGYKLMYETSKGHITVIDSGMDIKALYDRVMKLS